MGWFRKPPQNPPATDPTKPVGRQRPPGRPVDPITGKPVDENGLPLDTAIPRGSLINQAPVAPPPPTSLIASNNLGSAQTAADRMRKRAGAGANLLVPGGSAPGPKAKLLPKSLIGS